MKEKMNRTTTSVHSPISNKITNKRDIMQVSQHGHLTHMSLILDTPYIDIAIYAGSPNASIRRCHAASNSTWQSTSENI